MALPRLLGLFYGSLRGIRTSKCKVKERKEEKVTGKHPRNEIIAKILSGAFPVATYLGTKLYGQGLRNSRSICLAGMLCQIVCFALPTVQMAFSTYKRQKRIHNILFVPLYASLLAITAKKAKIVIG